MGIGIILDIILLAIVVLTVIIAAHRGFARVAIETAGWLLIILLVFNFSQPLSETIYDGMVKEPMETKVSEYVGNTMQSKTDSLNTDIWISLPPFLVAGAELAGITKDSMSDIITSSLHDGSQAITSAVMTGIIKPASTLIIRSAISILAILFGMFIIRLIARWVNSLVDLTIAAKLNKTLGAVLGVIKGLMFVLIACASIMLLHVLIFSGNDNINDFLNSSFIYDFFARLVMPLFN